VIISTKAKIETDTPTLLCVTNWSRCNN